MVKLSVVKKYLSRVTIVGAIISLIGGAMGGSVMYYLVYLPQLNTARDQIEELRKQNSLVSQQILLMNETLGLQIRQNQILQESLLRKPVVTINVYPAFEWHYIGFSNGTIRFEKANMSVSRDKPITFNIYISNVGTGVTQLFYLGIFVESRGAIYRAVSMPNPLDLGGRVLKPYETVNKTWTLDPEDLDIERVGTNLAVNILFAVMSTERTDYCRVTLVVRY